MVTRFEFLFRSLSIFMFTVTSKEATPSLGMEVAVTNLGFLFLIINLKIIILR